MHLNGCTQKVPLIDLKVLQDILPFCSVLFMKTWFHSFMNLGFREFWHLPENQKKFDSEEEIFLWSCEFIHYIADLIGFLYIFQLSLRSTYIYSTKKRVNYLGSSIWMKQKRFLTLTLTLTKTLFFKYFLFRPDQGFYW